jgi:glycosyltransferase involved in cell wall biosynthesis
MYCGSCLRDNALAAELLARGHDVLLLPIYTPTLTDEANVSDGRVFFGGISVYLEQHVPLFRRTPAFLDRLWDAPTVIRAATGRGVSVDPHDLGALTVSTLRGEDGNQAKEVHKLLGYLDALPPFDLVVLPNSLLVGLAPALKRALGRPVVCTLQGEDLFLDGLPEPHRTAARTLIHGHASAVDGFVATSAYYADFMAGYLGLDRRKVHAVPLGIRLDGHEPAEGPRSGPFVFGYLARVAPEKGLHLLAEAYRILRRERWLGESRLASAGYLAPEHRGYLADIGARFREWGLEGEFHYHGVLDRAEKIAFLQGLDARPCRAPTRSRRGSTCWRPSPTGSRVSSRATGPSPRCSRAREAGSSSSRTTRPAWPSS